MPYLEQPQAGLHNDSPDISAHGIYNVTLCTPSQLGSACDVAIIPADILNRGWKTCPSIRKLQQTWLQGVNFELLHQVVATENITTEGGECSAR